MELDLLDEDGGAFVRHLGLEFSEMTGGRVVATWTAAPKHHQSYGIVHGGVHASVVETLGSLVESVLAKADAEPELRKGNGHG